MKKSLLLIPAVLLFVACAGNAEKGNPEAGSADKPANPNDGTWVINKAEGMMADSNKGTEYIFDGDKLTLSGGGIKNKGTWEMSGDTLVFKMKTFEGEMRYIKEMDGDEMILKVVGSDQVFHLDKK